MCYLLDMDIKARVREVLERGHLMSLGTTDAGGVWVADVIYIFDDDLNLYWVSDPEVRHSKALMADGRVAATITVTNEKGLSNLGIQLSGRAAKVDGERHDLVVKHFAKRGKPAPKEGEDAFEGESWYQLTPETIDLIDEEHLGFDKKTLKL